MSDPKRDKPKDRKREETQPDRPSAPLPSITAPRFAGGSGPAATPEISVSVTSPAAPELTDQEPRTNTETTLDPSNYAPPLDKDPDELSSDFAPVSGRELDARGRLVDQPEPERARATPAPPPARGTALAGDEDSTDAAVPQYRPAPAPAPAPVARKVKARSNETTEPEPPVAQVTGQRSEPGRWVINRETKFGPEDPEPEPGAFDPTVKRAAPTPPPGHRAKKPMLAIAVVAGVAVVAAGGAALWFTRSDAGPGEDPGATATTTPQQPIGEPEPARIRITSKPSGAAVHINGVSLGVTPVDRSSPFAPEAELEVEVLLKGYRPWTRRFHAGQSVAAHAQLKPGR